jgi:dUTP pyrophosphatase
MKTLQIFVDSSDEQLITLYKEAAEKHNENVKTQLYADSGFDLYTPISIDVTDTILYNYQIICSMIENYVVPYGYMLYPRSSIYKTKLRLANSVGIIDSGYRGHICGAFDVKEPTTIEKYTRYVQICSPDLKPFLVEIVTAINVITQRGNNGFGSTGV